MSALDDVCGCGEADCARCFGGASPGELPVSGNAWLDEALDGRWPGIVERIRVVRRAAPRKDIK